MFELLLVDGPVHLTAMSKVSWNGDGELVDQVLFHLSDRRSRAETCERFGLSQEELDGILEKADERELFRIS
jgi:hypothetical protein